MKPRTGTALTGCREKTHKRRKLLKCIEKQVRNENYALSNGTGGAHIPTTQEQARRSLSVILRSQTWSTHATPLCLQWGTHPALRSTVRQGNWQAQRNCDFRELLTASIGWLEQRRLRKRQRNSRGDWETQLRGNGACQSSQNWVAALFPSVSCSMMLVSDSFVS
jgi:hypothetical protein